MKKKLTLIIAVLAVCAMLIVACAPAPAATQQPAPASEAPASEAPVSEPPASEAPASDAPALPTGEPIDTDPDMPQGQQAYILASYDNTTYQWQMFSDEMKKQGMQGELVYVAELAAWDSTANAWVPVNQGIIDFDIPFPFGKAGDRVIVMQNNSMTGGTIVHPSNIAEVDDDGTLDVSMEDAAPDTNNFGLGLFGFVIPTDAPAVAQDATASSAAPTGAPIDTDPDMPAGQQVYVQATYDNTTPQWQMFADEMKKQGMTGNLVYVAELAAWDSAKNEWVPVNQGVIDFEIPFSFGKNNDRVIVMQNNSMTGGTIVHPNTIAEVDDNGTLDVSMEDAAPDTNNFGLGLFGFVLPA